MLAGGKLDLSQLTDQEARHVWEVVQRDFDLRRKEEDRLGELKSKIEREDTKRELLGTRSSLTESYCIRCLEPFKFLVSIKRQCLDCRLHVCKSCSRLSKREQAWVCEPCHMARVLRIGTLEWYHENVRARFKRFGSAKVMRSLFKRFSKEHSCSQSDPGEFDTQSLPEVHTDGFEEHSMEGADSQHLPGMKKAKRRLTVDPVDFLLGWDPSTTSRTPQDQASVSHDITDSDGGLREPMLCDADVAAIFQHGDLDPEMIPQNDDTGSADYRTGPSRSVSRLSYSSCGSASLAGLRGCGSYLPSLEHSEAEDEPLHQNRFYQRHPGSQESLNAASAAPQISDLDRRMSAVENLLNRLEQKVTSSNSKNNRTPTPHSSSPCQPVDLEVDLEEQQLRLKLHQLTDNISDQSSEEEEPDRPQSAPDVPAWRSPQGDVRPSRIPTRPSSRTSVSSSRLEEELPLHWDLLKTESPSESPERKQRPLQEPGRTSFRGSTALLVELEDKVAEAAANVQSAESQVSLIENRIAALNAAGTPKDRRRRSAIPVQARRLSHNFHTKPGHDGVLVRRRLSII